MSLVEGCALKSVVLVSTVQVSVEFQNHHISNNKNIAASFLRAKKKLFLNFRAAFCCYEPGGGMRSKECRSCVYRADKCRIPKSSHFFRPKMLLHPSEEQRKKIGNVSSSVLLPINLLGSIFFT